MKKIAKDLFNSVILLATSLLNGNNVVASETELVKELDKGISPEDLKQAKHKIYHNVLSFKKNGDTRILAEHSSHESHQSHESHESHESSHYSGSSTNYSGGTSNSSETSISTQVPYSYESSNSSNQHVLTDTDYKKIEKRLKEKDKEIKRCQKEQRKRQAQLRKMKRHKSRTLKLRKLKNEYKKFAALKLGDRMLTLTSPMLRGNDVLELITLLRKNGFMINSTDITLADGFPCYDLTLVYAIKEFQTKFNIPVTGDVDYRTITVLKGKGMNQKNNQNIKNQLDLGDRELKLEYPLLHGTDVGMLIAYLMGIKLYNSSPVYFGNQPCFDKNVEIAVKKLQRIFNLPETGIVDSELVKRIKNGH